MTARLWSLDIDTQVRLACRTAGRNLTREEWRQHTGQLEPRLTCPEFSADQGEHSAPAAD
jgi:hypothetical protein